MVHVELPKGKQGVRHDVLSWPTGFHTLPEAGGVLDQPAGLMLMFDQFLAGERHAVFKRLSK